MRFVMQLQTVANSFRLMLLFR